MFRIPRRLLAVGGISVIAALGSGTMHAGAFSGQLPSPCGPFSAMECTGVAQPVQPGSDSPTEDMAFSCVAETTADEVSTTGTTGVACYLEGLGGLGNVRLFNPVDGSTSAWTNGPVSEMSGEQSVPVQPYKLCVAGGYFVNGTFEAIGNYACSQLNL